MTITLKPQENTSGDASIADQGFGRVAAVPAVLFDPRRQQQEAIRFFTDNGFVVLSPCLTPSELVALNEFFDRTQKQRPDAWGLGTRRKPHHREQGLIFSQPLLDYPELDGYLQHPASFRSSQPC